MSPRNERNNIKIAKETRQDNSLNGKQMRIEEDDDEDGRGRGRHEHEGDEQHAGRPTRANTSDGEGAKRFRPSLIKFRGALESTSASGGDKHVYVDGDKYLYVTVPSNAHDDSNVERISFDRSGNSPVHDPLQQSRNKRPVELPAHTVCPTASRPSQDAPGCPTSPPAASATLLTRPTRTSISVIPL